MGLHYTNNDQENNETEKAFFHRRDPGEFGSKTVLRSGVQLIHPIAIPGWPALLFFLQKCKCVAHYSHDADQVDRSTHNELNYSNSKIGLPGPTMLTGRPEASS